ncbi:MAG TPA: SDR family NAD(P)-dependent oxidoreductase [Dehalococcoidia bacterium]|nr:SDR family NAD(P)-dependent oxidoreductase [Dehalococcoidia bacterium]
MTIGERVVVVTGAASGIGRALAEGFAADEARVVGVDLTSDALSTLSDSIDGIVADVTSAAEVARVLTSTLEAHGRIDVWFNNAGIVDAGPFLEGPFADRQRVIDVNLTGLARCAHAVLPVMQSAGYGRLINVVSRAAENSAGGASAYAASKATAVSLTLSLAVIAAQLDADVLVNRMIPGPTTKPIWRATRSDLQDPEVVYPHALRLATLPEGGPNGLIFWNSEPYPIFERFTAVLKQDAEELS